MLIPDPWHELRNISPARIALGRAGGSLPTRELLDFALAHSRARDAVQMPFDVQRMAQEIRDLGCEVTLVTTLATTRKAYLTRPDWGRGLAPESVDPLQRIRTSKPGVSPAFDLVIVVSDGLSALAADRQVVPLLRSLLPRLVEQNWSLAPIVVAPFARVALQDAVGQILDCRLALSLLGERPGLNSPDSLGAYFVHEPLVGKTDADRNCVSNIRPEGLPIEPAAQTLYRLLTAARDRRVSGVALKDDTPALLEPREKGLPTDSHG